MYLYIEKFLTAPNSEAICQTPRGTTFLCATEQLKHLIEAVYNAGKFQRGP